MLEDGGGVAKLLERYCYCVIALTNLEDETIL